MRGTAKRLREQIASKLESIELVAGVPVGTWKDDAIHPVAWAQAVRLGLRQRTAHEARARKLSRS